MGWSTSPLAANAAGTVAQWPTWIPSVVFFRHALPDDRARLAVDAAVACAVAVLGVLALGERLAVWEMRVLGPGHGVQARVAGTDRRRAVPPQRPPWRSIILTIST